MYFKPTAEALEIARQNGTVNLLTADWVYFYQSFEEAEWARIAQEEGADEEITGPREQGWYMLNRDTMECVKLNANV